MTVARGNTAVWHTQRLRTLWPRQDVARRDLVHRQGCVLAVCELEQPLIPVAGQLRAHRRSGMEQAQAPARHARGLNLDENLVMIAGEEHFGDEACGQGGAAGVRKAQRSFKPQPDRASAGPPAPRSRMTTFWSENLTWPSSSASVSATTGKTWVAGSQREHSWITSAARVARRHSPTAGSTCGG